jgi:hypothetical protein
LSEKRELVKGHYRIVKRDKKGRIVSSEKWTNPKKTVQKIYNSMTKSTYSVRKRTSTKGVTKVKPSLGKTETLSEKMTRERKEHESQKLEPQVVGDIKWVKITIVNERRGIEFTNDGIRLAGPEEYVGGSDYTKTLFRKIWDAVMEEHG